MVSPVCAEGRPQLEGSAELVAFLGAGGSWVFVLSCGGGKLALWNVRNGVGKDSSCSRCIAGCCSVLPCLQAQQMAGAAQSCYESAHLAYEQHWSNLFSIFFQPFGMCLVKSVGQKGGGESAKLCGCRNEIHLLPPLCNVNLTLGLQSEQGRLAEITGRLDVLANETSPVSMALEFKGECRSDLTVFKTQADAPPNQPLWPCMSLCYGGRGALLLGGLIWRCSSCLLLQPAGQHSFTVNHQSLGSDVKQME